MCVHFDVKVKEDRREMKGRFYKLNVNVLLISLDQFNVRSSNLALHLFVTDNRVESLLMLIQVSLSFGHWMQTNRCTLLQQGADNLRLHVCINFFILNRTLLLCASVESGLNTRLLYIICNLLSSTTESHDPSIDPNQISSWHDARNNIEHESICWPEPDTDHSKFNP